MIDIVEQLELEKEDGKIIDDNEIKLIIEMNIDKLVKEIKDELEARWTSRRTIR